MRDFEKKILAADPLDDFREVTDGAFFNDKFLGQKNLEIWLSASPEKRHIITGFGPTNAPTAGTLSILIGALFLSQKYKSDMTVIVSNLGAFDSRNVQLEKISYCTDRFIDFIKSFDKNVDIRTHADKDLLVTATFSAKVLTMEDFLKNKEVLTDLYESLNLQGQDFGTFYDMNLTVADIILPILKDKKENVLVLSGIEENYFHKLSEIVLSRLNEKYENVFFKGSPKISSLYGKIIHGLNGYPKMSKSIPDSAISLEELEETLREKILDENGQNSDIILEMMQSVSDWDTEKFSKVKASSETNEKDWRSFKEEYLEYFLSLKKRWDKTECSKDKHVEPYYGKK